MRTEHNKHNDYRAQVNTYNNLSELEATLSQTDKYRNNAGGGWMGDRLQDALKKTFIGVTPAETKLAQSIMDKINTSFQETERITRVPHVAGSRVRMGAYLAGQPHCMVKRKKMFTDTSPIKVVMETTVAGGLTDEEIQGRGAACAALAVCLSQIRPVELYAAWGLGNSGQRNNSIGLVRVPTTPLGLAQALAILGTNGFCRNIAFTEIHEVQHNPRGGWAVGYPNDKERNEVFAKLIGLKDKDIFVPGGMFRDQLLKDPVAWVNAQVAKYR